jgi:hypothetical protein
MIKINKRREKDVMKLMLSEYDVSLIDDQTSEFFVTFEGPKESAYEGVQITKNPSKSHATCFFSLNSDLINHFSDSICINRI